MQVSSLLSHIPQNGARFASFTYRAKSSNELAKHTVALGVDLTRAYKRDLAILQAELPKLSGVERQACEELIASLAQSLTVGIGNNSAYTCADTYLPVCKGVKIHKETGELQVSGFSIKKNVIEPGAYKAVKSSPKTIAKNALRRKMKSGRFRQFSFGALESARLNGKTLEFVSE